jgi:hypothetical protein
MLDHGSLPAAALRLETQILPPVVASEGALLSTAQVASHLCGILFKSTDSVDENLMNIIEKRDPGKLLVPDGSGGAARRIFLAYKLWQLSWDSGLREPVLEDLQCTYKFLPRGFMDSRNFSESWTVCNHTVEQPDFKTLISSLKSLVLI